MSTGKARPTWSKHLPTKPVNGLVEMDQIAKVSVVRWPRTALHLLFLVLGALIHMVWDSKRLIFIDVCNALMCRGWCPPKLTRPFMRSSGSAKPTEEPPGAPRSQWCSGEKPRLVRNRWPGAWFCLCGLKPCGEFK